MTRMNNRPSRGPRVVFQSRSMSESRIRANTPPSATGRRRRFTGAHPYPALPKSRLPLVRGVLLLTWAAFLALLDALGGLLPGRRRPKRATDAKAPPEPRRPSQTPRMPSLTPTG
jgi:hypothetical protein